jgi:hypothetical protein
MRMGETSSTTDFSASGIASHSKGRFEKLTGHSCQVEGSYEVSPNKRACQLSDDPQDA